MRSATAIATGILIVLCSFACGESPPFGNPDTDGGFECGETLLECASDLGIECEAEETTVEVPMPSVCSDQVAISDDIPEGGFPVGETTVTFTGTLNGDSETCTMVVSVADTTAPDIQCDEALTVVRSAPDEIVSPPDPTSASDLCDMEVDLTTSPTELPYGVSNVEYSATDDSGNENSCSSEITVLDGFAVTSLRILSANLSGTTTSVTIGWEPAGGADATGYRIERATEPDGPYDELASVGLADVLYTDNALPGDHAYYRVVTMVGDVAGGTTEPLHAYGITADGYDLRNIDVPGISFLTTLYGVVRYPTDIASGPFPPIILMHGNHGNCRPSVTSTDDYCEDTTDHDCHHSGWVTTPNAEGMAFQAETLAAQGYIATSVSANALNCRDDYIPERTQLVLQHLRQWNTWNASGGDPFGSTFVGAVEMDNAGLVGHSRGGDAVSNVPQALSSTPISGVNVASIFAIAPTDYHDTTPVGTDYAVLLPACDGDVSSLIGMDIYDRGLDPSEQVVRAQVFYIGANHNYFSTEWYFDDGQYQCSSGDIISKQAHQGGLEAIEGAWFNGTLGAGPLDAFVRAEGPTPSSIDAWAGTDLDLRWSYSAPERMLIDEFAGSGAPDTNLLGGANTFANFTEYRDCYENGCDSVFEHQKDALYMRWDYSSDASTTMGLQSLDASSWDYLSFRIVSRWSTWNTGRIEQNFWMRVTDGDGDQASLLTADVQPIWHIYPTYDVREVLQTVRIPLANLTDQSPDLDLNSLATFEMDWVDDDERGSVLVTDVELAR